MERLYQTIAIIRPSIVLLRMLIVDVEEGGADLGSTTQFRTVTSVAGWFRVNPHECRNYNFEPFFKTRIEGIVSVKCTLTPS